MTMTPTEWETILSDPRWTANDDHAANNLRALATEVLGSERSWAALKLARNMIYEGVRADMATRISLRNAAPRDGQP